MPTQPTARRALLTLVLGLGVVLLVLAVAREWRDARGPRADAGATPTVPRPTPAWHPTYEFLLRLPLTGDDWHPGERLALAWDPVLDSTGRLAQRPTPVVCTFALYGPYPAHEAADAALVGAGRGAPGPVALALPPVTLDDWTATPQPFAVDLPATLTPGYYVAEGSSAGVWAHLFHREVVHVAPA